VNKLHTASNQKLEVGTMVITKTYKHTVRHTDMAHILHIYMGLNSGLPQ